MVISRTQQDYIKVIWNLEQDQQLAKMTTVAEILSLKPPTVLAMFRQLSRLALISYDKQQGAILTNSGRIEAERLIRKHRLIETFLNKVLHVEEPLLHNEAEKLEHVISDQLIMVIDEFLDYPRIDPHGSIIPLSGIDEILYPLDDIEEGIPFKIVQIPMTGKEKAYCSKNKLIPDTKWKIENKGPDGESFLLTNGKDYLALSGQFAKKIIVSVLKDT
jgi:DtxR family Mn-dependent transcriptional regulator